MFSSVVLSLVAFLVATAALLRASRDQRRLRRFLAHREHELQQVKHALELRGQLAGEIAHEIKNPLTAIQCSAESLNLLLAGKIEPDLQRSLEYIKEYSDHLLQLLSNFLELNRLEAGMALPKPVPVALAPLVSGVQGLLRGATMRKKITVITTALAPDLKVQADPLHVRQILFNLIHNATKYAPQSGIIEVRSQRIGSSVQLTVSDNGPGIPDHLRATLFSLYARGEGATEIGAGLGLAVVSSLAALNGGEVREIGTFGRGACFTVTLPVAPEVSDQPASPSVTRASIGRPLMGQAFLIVDQNVATRESISQLIRAWGGMVDQVSEATAALTALTENGYDAVVVDETVDGLPPLEASAYLKEQAQAKGTTIIVATPRMLDGDSVTEAGAEEQLQKPLSSDALLQSLLKASKHQINH